MRSFEESATNPVEQPNSVNKTGFRKATPNMHIMISTKKMTQK